MSETRSCAKCLTAPKTSVFECGECERVYHVGCIRSYYTQRNARYCCARSYVSSGLIKKAATSSRKVSRYLSVDSNRLMVTRSAGVDNPNNGLASSIMPVSNAPVQSFGIPPYGFPSGNQMGSSSQSGQYSGTSATASVSQQVPNQQVFGTYTYLHQAHVPYPVGGNPQQQPVATFSPPQQQIQSNYPGVPQPQQPGEIAQAPSLPNLDPSAKYAEALSSFKTLSCDQKLDRIFTRVLALEAKLETIDALLKKN